MTIRDDLLNELNYLVSMLPVVVNHENTTRRYFMATQTARDLIEYVDARVEAEKTRAKMDFICDILEKNP